MYFKELHLYVFPLVGHGLFYAKKNCFMWKTLCINISVLLLLVFNYQRVLYTVRCASCNINRSYTFSTC